MSRYRYLLVMVSGSLDTREAHLKVQQLVRDALPHPRTLVGHRLTQVTTELLQGVESHLELEQANRKKKLKELFSYTVRKKSFQKKS